MFYLDASFIVSLLTRETFSERALGWLAAEAGKPLSVSDWTGTEVSSALALKVRMGAMTTARRAEVILEWENLRDQSFVTLPVTAADFETAARFADRYELGLRAGDALHLAVAAAAGHRIVTFDRLMAKAAPECGIAVEPL